MEPIQDYVRLNLDILFVGFNPSILSSTTGHHFANPTNRFWTILYKAGITDRKYKPIEDYKLLDIGYGLTNIVARPTRNAQEITREEYNHGRNELKTKILIYKPKIVCFVGKGVYQQYSGIKEVPWGKQVKSVTPDIIDFVAPSSSGLVRIKVDDIAHIYSGLKQLL